MKSFPYVLSLVLLLVLGYGCAPMLPGTYQTTLKSELRELKGVGPIRALTIDSLLYTFGTFSFDDSLLSGNGTVKEHRITSPFRGSVPFRRIVFLERTEPSTMKTLWALPMIVGAFVYAETELGKGPNFSIWRPSPTGSSCPTIYAFDGKRYRLEAEAFGISISKSFQAETYSALSLLTPVEGELKIRVANERPETHVINSVHLFASDARDARSVVLDVNNVLWPLNGATPPTAARDHSGNDVLNKIQEIDGKYWQSDLANTTPFSGFHDRLEMQFDLPSNTSEATFVVRAINTELITEVYRSVGTLLGDETLKFYYALEHDTQLQSRIRGWIDESSLAVEARDGNEWKEVGKIQPEATAVAFSRGLRIPGLQNRSGPLRLRLSSLTDAWRIDAVLLDCSPVKPLAMCPLNMTTVSASDGRDWSKAIARNDSEYALVLPPNHLDIAFDPEPTRAMQKPVYVFAAQGYLYEWFHASPTASSSISSTEPTNVDRVTLLKLLIQEKNLFLPPLYAAWEKNREVRR
jgi:hypothetical protein